MCVSALTLGGGAHAGESVLIALAITTDRPVGLREKEGRYALIAFQHISKDNNEVVKVLQNAT